VSPSWSTKQKEGEQKYFAPNSARKNEHTEIMAMRSKVGESDVHDIKKKTLAARTGNCLCGQKISPSLGTSLTLF
jgi:hypothetical protein